MFSIDESSLFDLYVSAVEAFPHTTRRQHATQPIEIQQLSITPFLGVKTLFLKAAAINEGREYRPMILFKGVVYGSDSTGGKIQITTSDGSHRWVQRPSLAENGVVLRCNCDDFYWRFNYFDHLDKSLYGRKRAPYQARLNPGSANPMELPGMCKHLMKFAEVLNDTGFITN